MNCERAIDHVLDTPKPITIPATATSASIAPQDTPKPTTDPRPKECFSCGTIVETMAERCPKCGKGSFKRKVEVAKPPVVLVNGEDDWKRDDAHVGPEKLLQKVCHNRLSLLGVRYIVHLRAGVKTCDGLPDLIFVWKGHPIAVELKQKQGRIDDEQRSALLAMQSDGWMVSVIYSLPMLDEFLAAVADG